MNSDPSAHMKSQAWSQWSCVVEREVDPKSSEASSLAKLASFQFSERPLLKALKRRGVRGRDLARWWWHTPVIPTLRRKRSRQISEINGLQS